MRSFRSSPFASLLHFLVPRHYFTSGFPTLLRLFTYKIPSRSSVTSQGRIAELGASFGIRPTRVRARRKSGMNSEGFLKAPATKDEAMAPCKVLLVGATGYLGKYVTFACARLGHETFAIVRSTTPSDPAKAELLSKFQDAGITLLVGDISDKATLVPALKRVNVVISTVSMVPDQINLIEAAQEAGTIKRFLPSEFGNDVDRQGINDLDILKPIFGSKQQVRRALEKSGIPFTFVSSGSFAGHYLKPIVQDAKSPPRDGKLVVLGDGNAKAIFTDEDDIGTFTAKCLDDPRAENKSLHIRPKGNIASTNEVIALWEKKLGHTFEKEFMDDAQVAKSVESLPFPANFLRAIKHAVFVNGDQCAFDLDPAKDVEATELYPDVKYITIDEYLSRLV